MKIYLQNVVNSLKNYSLSLDKTSLLINKPWALVDSDSEIQKLIFKKNKELVISKNGQAYVGKWDYFPEAKSLLIDRGKDKILCNEAYIDEGVLILKLDGTQNDFYILANQNLIPDLDVYNYLMEKRRKHLNIDQVKLISGEIMEVIVNDDNYNQVGNFVLMDLKKVDDGAYRFTNYGLNQKFIIAKSRIKSTVTEVLYKTKDGRTIVIEQFNPYYFSKKDEVFINSQLAPSGRYKLEGFSNITVKDGKIIRKGFF